ncbi:DinB family protein [Pseudalkalibacillus hwajinpoensis]|uniref:DinB family protein n=1 Tax=Guptibacillus hwajinpoensis TaxID=208199 RepID=UPI001CD5CE7C|nr:DinB family protein [Pseudalkalibacillus hwajinpoensis]MCA0993407.1 DinB family protein [Pseudalkalibacillus hwajinpoensis]
MSNNHELLLTFRNDLYTYSLEQLRYISKEGVWSIGQMYDHLIVVAHEYLDHIETCSISREEQVLGKTQFGEQLYKNGGFPPIKIRLPDELNSPPNNTDSKEDLIKRMDQLIQRLSHWESKVNNINSNYKVEHGGFGWLNAKEWYELVMMHFRHHLRQKKELESYVL